MEGDWWHWLKIRGMKAIAKNFDEYLTGVSDEKRAALEHLRALIKAVALEAEECISYGLPTFRLHGRMLVAIGAAERHVALYPLSAAMVEQFAEELQGYSTSKGTIRFQVNAPLPDDLVRRIVEERMAENRRKGNKGAV